MSIRKKVKQLFRFHETTRLLIRDLEARHLDLVNRLYVLEQMVEGK
jgi:hypothetical protein